MCLQNAVNIIFHGRSSGLISNRLPVDGGRHKRNMRRKPFQKCRHLVHSLNRAVSGSRRLRQMPRYSNSRVRGSCLSAFQFSSIVFIYFIARPTFLESVSYSRRVLALLRERARERCHNVHRDSPQKRIEHSKLDYIIPRPDAFTTTTRPQTNS